MVEYLVFARASFDEPLTYRGTVEGDGPQDAPEAALERYGREWVELTVLPAADVRWVVGERAS